MLAGLAWGMCLAFIGAGVVALVSQARDNRRFRR
jgi:hypothetical protein